MEKQCPVCYFNLPDPESTIAPYDTELNYFMWGPGFEWQPEPEVKQISVDEENYEENEESEESVMGLENLDEKVDQSDAKIFFNENSSNGKINIEGASHNARKLGLAPSSADENKIRELYGDNLTYEQYLEYLSICVHEKDNVEELIKMFAHFDVNSTGFLSKSQMKNILITWGDTLTEQEAIDALNAFSNEDRIDYRLFCEDILH
ncbi:myosin A tail domain interacting protein, putative [Plasmodium ovale wallikeri]|uniref:Calmodulin n=2 Tax=Plasmodium ovale TaxID=36330 RepID=A0A1A9A267_PLAOA|nr:myosin A tail domain interacting protein, putative [Plasmodium ovale wallikeri]SBT50592.1 myosin A tail domain interacting protein, putative [Plasmodium ovale wallikeri]SBT82781.1 myosin A tail domain interacting protein, putative [Plasmodium ovale]